LLLASARLDAEGDLAGHLLGVDELQVGLDRYLAVQQAAAIIRQRRCPSVLANAGRASGCCCQAAGNSGIAARRARARPSRRGHGRTRRRPFLAACSSAGVAARGASRPCCCVWRCLRQLRDERAKVEHLVTQAKAAGHWLEGVQVRQHHVLLKDGGQVGGIDACKQACCVCV
jgi:hypothetical protein